MRWGQQHQRWGVQESCISKVIFGRGQRSPKFCWVDLVPRPITHAMSAAHRSAAYFLQPRPFRTYYTTCGKADFRLDGAETGGHFDDITIPTFETGLRSGARLERRIGKLELKERSLPCILGRKRSRRDFCSMFIWSHPMLYCSKPLNLSNRRVLNCTNL